MQVITSKVRHASIKKCEIESCYIIVITLVFEQKFAVNVSVTQKNKTP